MTEGEPCTSGALLARAIAGDTAAFGALVRRYQRPVYGLALRMLSDRHRAEDLAQEVFLQLYGHLAAIESPDHLSFWLRRVTMHRAIDRLRREPRFVLSPPEAAERVASEAVDADPILERRLRELLAELPPAARAVVLLRYQEDLDPVEIGRTLKMSVNTVKSHLRRSLALLRERLGASGRGATSDTPAAPRPLPSGRGSLP
ncbi:MAG TPA: sigma-70 family RNA polymerase sigma factor [Steroidobacteraceae bacterium]|nr:sigma-70 family RNA polymerase sigma factor [Steroidobacteraceae bacterium]